MNIELHPMGKRVHNVRGTASAVVLGQRCLVCLNLARRRAGAEFEHEVRCRHCNLIWEPGETYLMIEHAEEKS